MNVLEQFLAGRNARREQETANQAMAMNQFLQKQGGAIFNGDQNALGQLAGMGPQGLETAFNVRGQIDQRNRQTAQDQRQGVLDGRADQQWKMQLEEYAKGISAEQATAEAEQVEKAVKSAIMAETPEQFDALVTQLGQPDLVGQFENREEIAAQYMSMAEILKMRSGGDEPAGVQSLRIRAREAGLKPGTPEYEAFMAEGDAPKTVVNVGGKVETAFEVESAKSQATMFNTMVTDGANAAAELGQIEVIDQLIKSGVGGTADAWKSWAQNTLGIQVAGGGVEALDAALSKLVPTQRPPGSGIMSDKDVELFRKSLPQLINSQEGNTIIVETMRGMAEYKRLQGEIAQQVLVGRLTREQGLEALYALPDPLARAKTFIGSGDKPASAVQQPARRKFNPATGAIE